MRGGEGREEGREGDGYAKIKNRLLKKKKELKSDHPAPFQQCIMQDGS